MSEPALLDPPTTTGPAPAVSLTDLILLRLLPAKDSVAPKKLRDDLAVFFRRPLSAEQLAGALVELRADGFVTPKGQRATDAGRARAGVLGSREAPSKANWQMVKGKYLVPRALGLTPDSEEYAKAATGEGLAALLLKRQLRLPANTGHTLTKVVDALLCRVLGHPDFTDLNALIRVKLGEAVGGDPISKDDAKKVLPRVCLSVPQVDKNKLYAAVLDGRLDEPRAAPVADEPMVDEPFDLEMFANTVTSVAHRCPTGRFGDNKVFISHVWNQLRDEPRFASLGFDGFKAKLVEANRANLLTLSRADLVQLMDPADVRVRNDLPYRDLPLHPR